MKGQTGKWQPDGAASWTWRRKTTFSRAYDAGTPQIPELQIGTLLYFVASTFLLWNGDRYQQHVSRGRLLPADRQSSV